MNVLRVLISLALTTIIIEQINDLDWPLLICLWSLQLLAGLNFRFGGEN